METYNSDIASNPAVEMVHLSRDQDEESAAAWAKQANMPWPTILSEDADVKELLMPYFPSGRISLPIYVLVDRTGKEVARGKAAAMKMIKDAE